MTLYIYEGANGPVEMDSRTAELLRTSRDDIRIQTFVLCSGCSGLGCKLCEPPKPTRRRLRSYVVDIRKEA